MGVRVCRWIPHLTGFGKIPNNFRKRIPPPCRIRDGTVGIKPGCETHSSIPANGEAKMSGGEGDAGIQPAVRTWSDQLGFHKPPSPSSSPANFRCIQKFVGYFHKAQVPQRPRSYTQVLLADLAKPMVYPVSNRGDRRDGFGAGRTGRGAGRTSARSNVWQRVGQGRGPMNADRREEDEAPLRQNRGEPIRNQDDTGCGDRLPQESGRGQGMSRGSASGGNLGMDGQNPRDGKASIDEEGEIFEEVKGASDARWDQAAGQRDHHDDSSGRSRWSHREEMNEERGPRDVGNEERESGRNFAGNLRKSNQAQRNKGLMGEEGLRMKALMLGVLPNLPKEMMRQKKQAKNAEMMRGYQSAPGKFQTSKPGPMLSKNAKEEDDDEGVIPAATYEPSDSSEDYPSQVNKIMGDGAESSRQRDAFWMSNVEVNIHEQNQLPLKKEKISKSAVVITELFGADHEKESQGLDKPSGVEAALHPCEMLQQARDNRRWSERALNKMMKNSKHDGGDDTSKKRNVEDFQGGLVEGVKALLACAHKVLAQQSAGATVRMLPPAPEEGHEDEED
ncbi:hypothetical protein C2845_PM11G08710 [Panicum miliaceum]|uniref:Uncharacterized protein n=1 Tax=Panicum miliaceum TaxID=4540 RepID=A0A3L6RUZ4_PANMI|nr:hypothetical protein C2845_PM11G08710 [Panicum miliaceum]